MKAINIKSGSKSFLIPIVITVFIAFYYLNNFITSCPYRDVEIPLPDELKETTLILNSYQSPDYKEKPFFSLKWSLGSDRQCTKFGQQTVGYIDSGSWDTFERDSKLYSLLPNQSQFKILAAMNTICVSIRCSENGDLGLRFFVEDQTGKKWIIWDLQVMERDPFSPRSGYRYHTYLLHPDNQVTFFEPDKYFNRSDGLTLY